MALPRLPIHEAAWAGDDALLRRALETAGAKAVEEMGRLTPNHYSALMCAVASPAATTQTMKLLIDAGADVSGFVGNAELIGAGPMMLALRGGDPAKVDALVLAGANLERIARNQSALLDAIHGRNVHGDPRLLDLLRYLVSKGVDLNFVSEYSESGLRVLSRLGRFDAVKLLLEAGANESQLSWNPLIRAVAIGTHADVKRLLDEGEDPEARDYWQRTAWLVAIAAGNLEAAKLLRDSHADTKAVGRRSKPALFYAIETRNLSMLDWLLEQGFDVGVTDESGETPLQFACEYDFIEGIERLIEAGADVNVGTGIYPPLGRAGSAAAARRLLAAGADPANLSEESQRLLLGLSREPNVGCLTVTAEEFERGAARRFGRVNPEQIDEPYWTAMIRAGVDAYSASNLFADVKAPNPVWCAKRFGQSLTFLPDGRIVQVGGEHEDSYDPDFCIYNDVFVHDRGSIRIFCYPEDVFPPTDSHTATLVGQRIILIGSIGYFGTRRYGETPAYSLDTESFAIEKLETHGEKPGWIFKHRAILREGREIVVTGGTIVSEADGDEQHLDNECTFVLDLATLAWRRES
jgi:ankyrin repeat protein